MSAVLAWIRTGDDEEDVDLFELLRQQDPDWLAGELAALAAEDPSLKLWLLSRAEDGEARDDAEDLREELTEVLDALEEDAASEGDYGEWYPDADGLDDLLDEVDVLVPEAPDAVRELADYVIARCVRLLDYENCYGGGISEALEKAQDIHLEACETGMPDPGKLAERLIGGALDNGWGAFTKAPEKYAQPLGAAGLARCRELLEGASRKQYGWDGLMASLRSTEEEQLAESE